MAFVPSFYDSGHQIRSLERTLFGVRSDVTLTISAQVSPVKIVEEENPWLVRLCVKTVHFPTESPSLLYSVSGLSFPSLSLGYKTVSPYIATHIF